MAMTFVALGLMFIGLVLFCLMCVVASIGEKVLKAQAEHVERMRAAYEEQIEMQRRMTASYEENLKSAKALLEQGRRLYAAAEEAMARGSTVN